MCCENIFSKCVAKILKCVVKILKCVVKISEFVVNLKCVSKNLECVSRNLECVVHNLKCILANSKYEIMRSDPCGPYSHNRPYSHSVQSLVIFGKPPEFSLAQGTVTMDCNQLKFVELMQKLVPC